MSEAWRRRLTYSSTVRLCADLVGLAIAMGIAVYFERRPMQVFINSAAPVVLFALLVVSVSAALGAYRNERKIPLAVQVGWLLAATVMAIPVVYAVSLVLPSTENYSGVLGIAALGAFGGLILLRQVVVGPILDTYVTQRLLVLGTGPDARDLEASLAATAAPNVRLLGFYPLDQVPETSVSRELILSSNEALDDVVRRLRIDEIIVAVRQQRGGVLPLRRLLDCRLAGIRVTDLAKFYERVHGRVPLESVKASWLIYGEGFRQGLLRRVTKRVFDILVSLVMLIAMAPVMLLVAVLIAAEGGGPIIYRQERVGLRGKPFVVLKFRSMRNDAEKDGKAQWASAKDARTTSIGGFLRQVRLDELPQLINVLKGEMSFVGPRPERPPFVAILTEQIPFYAARHSVKPGITGWAQVRYSYGASVEESGKKLEFDLYYVKNNSLLLDLRILVETVRVVLLREGAR